MLYVPRRYSRTVNTTVLRPVRPNPGVAAHFKATLLKVLDLMHREVKTNVTQTYAETPPEMAMDALSSAELRIALQQLAQRWLANFDVLAQRMAEYFSKNALDRADGAMERMLRDAGFTVTFRMTPAMRDVFEATVHENTNLIRSIPQRYLGEVEGLVMRSVQTGRDLKPLSDDLQDRYNVTKKRAALIARDQNNKATSAFQRVRQVELGIKQAIWMHSHAGKKPRPTHVAMDGKTYNVSEGMWDSHEQKWVFPGELINCRCTSRSVIPGL